MNSRLGLLGAVLVVQLLIIAAVLFLGTSDEGPAGNLIELDADAIDQIDISDADQSVTLTKADAGWQIDDLPADQSKVDELVETFGNLSAPWPVSTTGSTAERFEVTSENHQRRLVFSAGGNAQAEVYLGTSPGFQRVHARVEGSDEVHSVAFSNFKAPTAKDDWLDKTLLAAVGNIEAITTSTGVALISGEEGWLQQGAAADQDAAQTYVERLSNLRVLGVADQVPDGATDSGNVELTDGEGSYTLSFRHDAGEDDYFVTSTRLGGVFKLATYIAEQILTDGADLAASETDAES